jgi:hypothetical protein
MLRIVRHNTTVIPAPLASEASKREQAGTHAPGRIRLIESMNPQWIDHFNEETGEILDGPADGAVQRLRARARFEVHGSRPSPARAFQALAAPR